MRIQLRRVRALASGAALMAAVACGDGPTAPPQLNQAEVQRILPALADARLRLAPAIEDPAIRRRVVDDFGQIELSLGRSDARGAAFRSRLLYRVLYEYASQPGAIDRQDAADVSALAFAILELSDLLDLGQEFLVIQ